MKPKMTRWAVLILGGVVIASLAIAKPSPETGKVGPVREVAGDLTQDKYMVMDVSNIWTAVSNFGNYGDPNVVLPSGQWPSGSGNNYIWEGRFWVGALVQGKRRVSHADYGDYEFHAADTDPVDPFYQGPGKSIQDSRVIYDDYFSTATHTPLGVKVLQRGLSWSMPEYSNFIAFEYEILNDGTIGTLSNFYAAWVFDNDVAGLDATEPHIDDNVDYDGWDGTDTDTDQIDIVDPLDLDDDGYDGYDEWGIPYGWSNPDNPNYGADTLEPDGVWDEYQIYLDDNGPVILCQTGEWAGQPLGRRIDGVLVDTLHGWLLSRNMSIIYDGDNKALQGNDTGERNLPIPCDGWTGGRLIYTPRAPYYAAADDTMPRPYAHQWWNWNSDPGNDDEKFEYMSATHAASMGFNFIPNPREIGAPTFDYRWLTSSGPFTFSPGDTMRFVYVFCIGQGLKGVRQSADQAMKAYYAGSTISSPAEPLDFVSDLHWVLPVPPPIPNLNYTGINEGIRLAWDNHAEFELDPLLGFSDFEGYKIYRAGYAPTGWQLIYACDNLLNTPVYVVNTEGDTLNPRNPEDSTFVPEDSTWVHPYVPIDLPDIAHHFEDVGGIVLGEAVVDTILYNPDILPWTTYEQPVNNVPYYYAVVAYDSYKPATAQAPEFLPQESARANYLKDPSSGAPMPVYPLTFSGGEEGEEPSGGVPPDWTSTYADVSHVKVVPNPYRGTNLFEARYEETIRFINLPPVCKITILTLAGDIVQTLDHNNGTDTEAWEDLLSKNTQAVVSGLYLYVVETSSDKKVGKFVIAR